MHFETLGTLVALPHFCINSLYNESPFQLLLTILLLLNILFFLGTSCIVLLPNMKLFEQKTLAITVCNGAPHNIFYNPS